MPSPELGAGPGPLGFPKGSSKPLPSGMPSPELGAGPGASTALAAALTERTAKAKIATIARALISFFIYITINKFIILYSNIRYTLKQPFHSLPQQNLNLN
jgi:hypothetical protein